MMKLNKEGFIVEDKEQVEINWKKAFQAQQALASYYIYQVMENELDIPKFKNNTEKNKWFKKQLLVNKYDYAKNAPIPQEQNGTKENNKTKPNNHLNRLFIYLNFWYNRDNKNKVWKFYLTML